MIVWYFMFRLLLWDYQPKPLQAGLGFQQAIHQDQKSVNAWQRKSLAEQPQNITVFYEPVVGSCTWFESKTIKRESSERAPQAGRSTGGLPLIIDPELSLNTAGASQFDWEIGFDSLWYELVLMKLDWIISFSQTVK